MRKAPFVIAILLVWGSLYGQTGTGAEWQIFNYSMTGKVRLLLFWVGRDDVGGGSIGVGKRQSPEGRLPVETIEVLFGSNPKRVPGGVNRWGYGRESALWERSDPAQKPRLNSSVFEGFMRHSSEESLSEVRSKAAKDKAQSQFWYDAITSVANRNEVSATIHYFSLDKDFDFTQPAAVECGYQSRLKAGPPDRVKRLAKGDLKYSEPFGFLTAVYHLTRDISGRAGQGATFAKYRPVVNYLYNGKDYRLAVTDLHQHRSYTLEGKDKAHSVSLSDVVEAGFEVTNLKSKESHSFSLWFPTKGNLQGIPVKIVDKPRWWLRVELNMDPESVRQGGIARSTSSMPECR